MEECNNTFCEDMAEIVEADMFRKLGFQLNRPTCLDLMLQLMHLPAGTNLGVNPSKVFSIQNLIH